MLSVKVFQYKFKRMVIYQKYSYDHIFSPAVIAHKRTRKYNDNII